MKKIASAALVAFAATSASSAFAADLAPVYKAPPPPPVASWTGVYLGLGLGTRSAVVDGAVTSGVRTSTTGAPPFNLIANCVGGPPAGPLTCPGGESLDNTAFRVSPYLGYNLQIGSQWVVGIEGDWGFASASRTLSGMEYPGGSAFLETGNGTASFSVKTGWDASIRARAGVLITPTILAYVTGGPAWLRLEQTSNCPTTPFSFCGGGVIPIPPGPGLISSINGPASITDSTTRVGWTIGGGFEAMLWGNWIARAEYRYADFGTWSPTDVRTCIVPGNFAGGCTLAAETITDSVRVRTHTATFGLAYKFGEGMRSGLSGAMAADPMYYKAPPPAVVASWTGLHLGLGVGTRSAVIDGSVPSALQGAGVNLPAANWVGPPFCGPGTGNVCPGGESLDNTAFRVSPYLGYDYQFDPKWLVGLEGDWGWASASRTLSGVWEPGGSPNFFQGQGDATFTVKTTWDASLRARVGYLVTSTVLVYATGGPAWLHAEKTAACPSASPANFCGSGLFQPNFPLINYTPASITDTTTRVGATVGAGIEAMFWRNWIIRGEYRYSDFGTWTNTDTRLCGFAPCASSGLIVTDSLRLRTHTATFGLAYKFDWSR